MRNKAVSCLMAVILILLYAISAGAEITGLVSLNDKSVTVGVSQGSSAEAVALKELPEARLVYFNDNPSAYLAVAQGKVDAYVYDYNQMRIAIDQGVTGVHLLEETLSEPVRIAVGISPASEIPDLAEKLNRFIGEIRANGTLDDMFARWVTGGSDKMPEIEMSANPACHLTVGTTGIVPPFSYYVGTELTGYDIELALRFAAWLGADVDFKVYDYGAIVPAAVSGDVDVIMADLNITPERAEALPFSDVLFEEKLGIMVRGDQADSLALTQNGNTGAPAYDFSTGGIVLAVKSEDLAAGAETGLALASLRGKRIAVQTGTTFDEIVLAALPDAQISYYNSYPDMAAALETNKIDGFPGDDPVLRLMAAEDPKLMLLSEYMDEFETGFVLPKTEAGDALLGQINAWLAKIRENGELDRIISKWADGPEAEKTLPDYASYPATNGTLVLATEGTYAPMNYYRGDEVVGFEIELAANFCEANGYGLKVEAMNFDGILPAVQTGKADFAAAGISITEERKENVNFSDPYYIGGTAMMVLKGGEPAAVITASSEVEPTFLGGLQDSFNKTFLREERWKLFVQGVLTTLLITVLAMLFGTALGFMVFMLCRNGNVVANGITRFCVWLVQGTPMVVLLMILYYIIFGSVAISGIAVAVIGFTLTFGAAVYGLLKMGVGAVDNGQYEAAYALGYSNRRTFFRIILPQALPHVLPAYKGEIVGLIKATAIVGYIAVQDLTKMGDIVRSRTYEAFFPLIAITVIYFALEGLLGFVVSRISVNLNPKRRKPADVLKGVKTDD